jgi:hypothetical protein
MFSLTKAPSKLFKLLEASKLFFLKPPKALPTFPHHQTIFNPPKSSFPQAQLKTLFSNVRAI